MKWVVAAFAFATPWFLVVAPGEVSRVDWARHYEHAGVEGSFLLYDVDRERYLVHNGPHLDHEYVPASTFKILNSLIALETGVLQDETEILAWDGVDRDYTEWNRDQDLRSAFENSTVWFYQELARRIGEERMQEWVTRSRYGNMQIGGGIDRFWLDGDLRITPRQQVEFLVRLENGDLPFSERTMRIVRDVMILEKGDDYVLRGKTGLAIRVEEEVGWFVGYLKVGESTYFFANQIDLEAGTDWATRKTIARAILEDLELLPPAAGSS